MENQTPQPALGDQPNDPNPATSTDADQPTNPQPVVPANQPINPQPVATAANQNPATPQQDTKPKLNVSDSTAESLLLINNLQGRGGAAVKPKKAIPLNLIIVLMSVVAVVAVLYILLGTFKPGSGGGNPGGVGLPNQSNTTSGSDTTHQVSQDVKTCSNPVNALTVC